MPLDRIAGSERDVVAALDHARASAFAEQAFYRDGDVERRIGAMRVQCGEETGAARAENENVGANPLNVGHIFVFTPNAASAAARFARASASTDSYRLPPRLSMATRNGPKPRMRNCHRLSGFRSSRSTSSIASIHVVSNAAVPPMIAR